MSLKESLIAATKAFPVVNTHCHHAAPEFFEGMHLRRLMDKSYVSWIAPVPEPELNAPLPAEWFGRVGLNSYFLSLQKGMQALYGIAEPLNPSTWSIYDEAVRAAHANDGWHMKILREHCGYRYIIQDSYWNTGTAIDDKMFRPNFRVDMFFCVHDTEALNHDNNNALRFYGLSEPFPSMEKYIEFIYDKIKAQRDKCCALKSALAYDCSLHFSDETPADAGSCYARLLAGKALPSDFTRAQNYIFFRICEMAGELDMPFQIHTGLGQLGGTNALGLLDAIKQNEGVKFVLFHGSYPYLQDILALSHNFKNVYADLCWLPIISPAAAARFVDEYIEVAAGGTLTWGCDTWTGEESLGSLLAAREVLCSVVAQKIQSGYMSEDEGATYLKGVFHDNAMAIFGL